jgi:hypothetical protein
MSLALDSLTFLPLRVFGTVFRAYSFWTVTERSTSL